VSLPIYSDGVKDIEATVPAPVFVATTSVGVVGFLPPLSFSASMIYAERSPMSTQVSAARFISVAPDH